MRPRSSIPFHSTNYLIRRLRRPASQLHCQKQKIQADQEKRRVVEKKVGEPEQVVSPCAVLRVTRIIADGKLRAGAAAETSIWDPDLLAGSSGKAERSGSFRDPVTFPGNQAVRLDNRGLCQRRSRFRAPPHILHVAIIRESAVQSEEQ